MSSVQFLIDFVFNIYLMVVLLRLWLQFARADFYNPFSQFVVKATQPIVAPMRRILPSIGRLDTATLVLALLVAGIKIVTLNLVLGGADLDILSFSEFKPFKSSALESLLLFLHSSIAEQKIFVLESF